MGKGGGVALVTDSLVGYGGADRLLETLLEVFPDADIYTSVFDPKRYPFLSDKNIRTTCIQRLPGHSFWKRHYVLLSPIGFEQFDFTGYGLVVSLSAGCAKGVITRAETLHIGIILSPPRSQWEGRARGNGFHPLRALVDSYLRVWDMEASMRPDHLVAISKYVKQRISSVYKRDSENDLPCFEILL